MNRQFQRSVQFGLIGTILLLLSSCGDFFSGEDSNPVQTHKKPSEHTKSYPKSGQQHPKSQPIYQGFQTLLQTLDEKPKLLYSGIQPSISLQELQRQIPEGESVRAMWSGYLQISRSGEYIFNFSDKNNLTIFVNGKQVKPKQKIQLMSNIDQTLEITGIFNSLAENPYISWQLTDGIKASASSMGGIYFLSRDERNKLSPQNTQPLKDVVKIDFEDFPNFHIKNTPRILGWHQYIVPNRLGVSVKPITMNDLVSPGRNGSKYALKVPQGHSYTITRQTPYFSNFVGFGAEYTLSVWGKADNGARCWIGNYHAGGATRLWQFQGTDFPYNNGQYVNRRLSYTTSGREKYTNRIGVLRTISIANTSESKLDCEVDDISLAKIKSTSKVPNPVVNFVKNGEMSSSDGKTFSHWSMSGPASWKKTSDGLNPVLVPGWDGKGTAAGTSKGAFTYKRIYLRQVIKKEWLKPKTEYAFKARIKGKTPYGYGECGIHLDRKDKWGVIGSESDTWHQGSIKYITPDVIRDVAIVIMASDGVDCALDDIQFGPVKTSDVPSEFQDQLPYQPTPPDMTYGSPIALKNPILSGTETAYFNIYSLGDDMYKGKDFQWSFGDGATGTGPTVKHAYKKPGVYTVTLNYIDAQGLQKQYSTQVASISIAKVVDKGARNDSLTATFDAGSEIPGLTYEYTIQDKNDKIVTLTGSKVSHTYAGIGTFNYTLTIRDNRNQSLNSQSFLTSQSTGSNRIIFQRKSWHAIWQRPPIAKFTWQGSDLPDAPLSTIKPGQVKTTVSFDATPSYDDTRNMGLGGLGSKLQYEWDFGDGNKSIEKTPTHTYSLTKPYVVTLTVTNAYGLKARKRVLYHVRDYKYKTALRSEYVGGILPQALKAKQVEDENLITAQRTLSLTPSPTDNSSPALFPWVLPYKHHVKRGSHYPISPATGGKTNSLCASYKLYVNGRERYPWYLENSQDLPDINIFNPIPVTPKVDFCRAMVMVPGNLGALRSSAWNTVDVYHSRGVNSTIVNTFHHLNVPRVLVNVLPDELIHGEKASPIVDVNYIFNEDTKVKELLVNVLIRKSELDNGDIRFKVPVFAVDVNGKLQTTLDGAMYAKFTHFADDSNDPIIFVDGRAEMPVRLRGNLFRPNAQKIDLTDVYYYSSNGDCGYGDSPLAKATDHFLAGCAPDKATHAYPTRAAPVEIKETPEFVSKSHQFLGHVIYGQTNEEFVNTMRETLDKSNKATLDVIDIFIPILWNERRKEYFDIINHGHKEGQFTLIQRLQLAGLGVGLILDPLPVVNLVSKGVRKAAYGTGNWIKGVDQGSRTVIKAAEKSLTPAATAGKTPKEAYLLLRDSLGKNTTKLLNECNSQVCYDIIDDLSEAIKLNGYTDEQTNQMIDKAIKRVEDWTAVNNYKHLPDEKINNAKLMVACKLLPNSFAPKTLVKTIDGLMRIDRVEVGMKVAGFDEKSRVEGFYPVTAVHKNYDSEITVLSLVTNEGKREQITTTPKHLFYTSAGKWVEAAQLTNKDQLQRAGKTVGQVINVTTSAQTQQMFNLTVDQAHTFFVGTHSWLVHNEKKMCLDLFKPRDAGAALNDASLPEINKVSPTNHGSQSDIGKAGNRSKRAPYSVEEGARVIALQVQQLMNKNKVELSNTKISEPMYGIVVNIETKREVNSRSGLITITEDTHPDLYNTNHTVATSELKARGKEVNCAEPQGCALLLEDKNVPPRKFEAGEYVVYAYRVDMKDLDKNSNIKIIEVRPVKRCDKVCSRVNYDFSPTDEMDFKLVYEFIIKVER